MNKVDVVSEVTPTEYTGSYADNLLRISLDVAEGLLVNGADVHRVELAVGKICRAYGAVHVEVFSIHSLIIASVRMADGSYSAQTRRITDIANNITLLERYNALSRTFCTEKPGFNDADRMLYDVKHKNKYPNLLIFLGYIFSASSFAVFFGGTLRDGFAALLVGVAVYFIDRIRFDYFNHMVKTMFSAFFAGLIACMLVRFNIADNLDMVIVGSMMLMIPGLSLGNSMRDILCGDTLAGMLKLVQAIILATMIAIGYALSIVIVGGGL